MATAGDQIRRPSCFGLHLRPPPIIVPGGQEAIMQASRRRVSPELRAARTKVLRESLEELWRMRAEISYDILARRAAHKLKMEPQVMKDFLYSHLTADEKIKEVGIPLERGSKGWVVQWYTVDGKPNRMGKS